MAAVVEAGPDMAFGIDDWAVGPGVREMRLHIGEGSRRTDAFGAEIGDHAPLAERVGEIDFRAVAVHRGTVGDREPFGPRGGDASAVAKKKNGRQWGRERGCK